MYIDSNAVLWHPRRMSQVVYYYMAGLEFTAGTSLICSQATGHGIGFAVNSPNNAHVCRNRASFGGLLVTCAELRRTGGSADHRGLGGI